MTSSPLRVSLLLSLAVLGLLWTACGGSRTTAGDQTSPEDTTPSVDTSTATLKGGQFAGYNVLLVSLDAVRASSMSLYGNDHRTTPHIDALAESSFVFERAVSPSAWTVPATMSIWTGLWPSEHKVLNKYTSAGPGRMIPTVLGPMIGTFPEDLARRGLRAAGFTGDAGVSGKFGYSRGFERYVDDVKFGGFDYSGPEAEKWLRLHADERFFIFLHGYDAHGQYDPPEGYRRVFVQGYDGPLRGGKAEQGELREKGLQAKVDGGPEAEPVLDLTEEDFAFYEALYDEKIQDADARLQAFLGVLTDLDLMDRTIIVITADHGEEFGEHGYLDHGPTLYDELIHVPLVIRVPGVPGRRIARQVRTVDIFPTVYDLLGYDVPMTQHGVSLVPLMNGEPWSQTAYAETDYRLFTRKRAVLDEEGRYKFILTLESGRRELYDLQADPGETTNLVDTETAVAYEMEQDLLRWMKSMGQTPEDFRQLDEEPIKEY